ncbi:MAG: hypothetical protein MJZ66_08370 [Bacteroidales bacterium]|nr:hypothetical protein [Bacteroidales bacterium]
MKNLTTNHISARQTVLSELINTSVEPDMQQYVNVKISLINNAIVFPVPDSFDVNDFSQQVAGYINNDLKSSSVLEMIGHDVYSHPFSPIGLGLMKKTVVYMLLDNHLYINIVPLKEIANANYKEGAISGLLSSGKTDKIYEYVESYIMSLYAANDYVPATQPYGRYFFTTSLGLSTIFASHMEEGERILAKLDIYKIEQSKSNASTQTSDSDEAFYVCTTHGAYLMVLDDNLQEKYIETLSDHEMKVVSKLGRDLVTCGSSQWLCNRDNNNLFAEVAPLNNIPAQNKLESFAQQHFNNADNPEDRLHAAELLYCYAGISNSMFSKFSAALVEYVAYMHADCPGRSDDKIKEVSENLMESANSLFSETEFEDKVLDFVQKYSLGAQELFAVIFVICRVKNRIEDPKVFASMIKTLKERYFKSESDSINRGFACLTIAKKLNMIADKESAYKFAQDAYDLVGYNPAVFLAPGGNALPDSESVGDALSYLALQELYKSSTTDKDKLKFAQQIAVLKPLVKSNLDIVAKHSQDEILSRRISNAMEVLDSSQFWQSNVVQDSGIEARFSKMSNYMPKYTEWRKTYSGFDSWLKKAVPDKTLSSMKAHGILVDSNNYHSLFEIGEQLQKCFDLDGVDLYVFGKRNQGVVGYDDGEGKYIFVDGELLDISNPNYMNGSELTFALAREYAAIKLGIAKLSCHAQWRNFAELGVQSLDAIKVFAADPDFIKSEQNTYNRILNYGKLVSQPDYFNFDVEDVENAAKLLVDSVSAVKYSGSNKLEDLKEREYGALAQLTCLILDRVAIMITGNLASAIKSIIHNDIQQRALEPFDVDNTVTNYICNLDSDGKPVHYDLAYRVNNLISFYISDGYKKY